MALDLSARNTRGSRRRWTIRCGSTFDYIEAYIDAYKTVRRSADWLSGGRGQHAITCDRWWVAEAGDVA